MRMMIYVILMVDEWSAQGQSDSNLEHKGQAVADTRINRLTRWLTGSVNPLPLFCDIMKIEYKIAVIFVDKYNKLC